MNNKKYALMGRKADLQTSTFAKYYNDDNNNSNINTNDKTANDKMKKSTTKTF